MCDLISETDRSSIIRPIEESSKIEKFSDLIKDEECNKDSAPERSEKSDTCDKVSTQASGTVVDKLVGGFLPLYLDDMKKASCSLNELTQNQRIVIETLQQENKRFTEALKMHHLDDVFLRMKHYHAKVQLLKKDLLALHEKTSKLKKRAMRLQQQKQKEALQKELLKDRELERDKQLAPKIATKTLEDK